MEKIENFIGGGFLPPSSGAYLDNVNPATGRVYSLIPDSEKKDVDMAVDAAAAAFPLWSKTSPETRASYLNKIAQAITRNLDALAKAESMDNGKPVTLARKVDIPRSSLNFSFFAEAVVNFQGEQYRTSPEVLNQTEFSPLGVVGCISPWNLPLYLFSWKIAPALAAGNTVVAKPSEVTPMTAYLLSKIVVEIGLPPGVLNIVHGTGPKVGDAVTRHPLVKAISFTGSTATGRLISEAAAKSFKKVSLEMGGKNPNIIFADADFDTTLDTTVRSTFSNQGQICLCGSRIFIERPIYEKFRDALVACARALRVGDPSDEATDLGALVSKPHFDKVRSYIELAKRNGGKVLCGGESVTLPDDFRYGYFLAPTLIEGLSSLDVVNQEEIFGPVGTLIPFDSEEEVIAMANSTRYGLAASLWTTDRERAQRVARRLESGIVWVNCWMLRDLRTPFGGVKESGVGREGGEYALRFFSEIKNICVMEYPKKE